ncbi:MAG TPA: tetratricopeptide repeat protein, partial [Myxococcota bacterium]
AAAAAPFEASAAVERGNAAMNAGRNADAVELYDRAEKLGYDKFPLYANRGFIHMQENRFSAAVVDLKRAVELRPEDLHQRSIVASVLVNLDRKQEAREVLEAVIAAEPADVRTLIRVARVLHALGDLDRARPILDGIKGRTGSAVDQRNLHALIGDIALEEGRADAAVEAYDAAQAAGATHWTFSYNRARAKLAREDYEGSERDARLALKRRPDLAHLRAVLALSLAKLGKTDDALTELHAVLAVQRDAWATFYAARACEALDDRSRAADLLEELRAKPGLPRALLRQLTDS